MDVDIQKEESPAFGQCWSQLNKILRPFFAAKFSVRESDIIAKYLSLKKEIEPHLRLLKEVDYLPIFQKYVLHMFSCYFHNEVLPQFLETLKLLKSRDLRKIAVTDEILDRFLSSVNEMQNSVEFVMNASKIIDEIPNLEISLHSRLTDLLKSFILYHVREIDGLALDKIFMAYFQVSYSGSRGNKYLPKRRLRSSISRFDKKNPESTQLDQSFYKAFSFLFSLSLFDQIFRDPLKLFLEVTIRDAVVNLCTTDFLNAEVEFMAVKDYAEFVCLIFVSEIVALKLDKFIISPEEEKFWTNYVSETVKGEVALFRIEQIFAMIVEYPDSQPAIDNLIHLLSSKKLTNHLVKSVKSAFETRLLHPGANTSEILTQYINAIKVLGQLDDTCSILDRTCAPLIKYLRAREDTVRCIVCNMTEDAELAGELLRRCELQVAPDPYESDDEDIDWHTWKPKPRDYIPGQSDLDDMFEAPVVQSHRNQDIMSILVNIYDSKEIFVNEYRSLLADRILNSSPDFDSDKELRHLELLSYKFGNDEINKCNVMLRDVAESKRTNEQLVQSWNELESHAEDAEMKSDSENSKIVKPDFPIRGTILSAQFWPTLKEEKIELPPKLKQAFQCYKVSYEGVKQTRTVEWIHNLGKVEVELESKDGSVREFTVTPLQAAVLSILETETKMGLEDLSSNLGISASVVRRKLGGLLSLGVLIETNGIIELVEDFAPSEANEDASGGMTSSAAGPSSSSTGPISLYGNDDEDNESAMANEKELKEEEMKCYWMYTVSMLRNLKSMSAENIHSMIKMFSKAGNSTELSQEDLTAFLNKKVREELLCYTNGVYRLPNKN